MAIDIVARSLAVSVKQIAVVANSAITPGTHTKITYDSKGLVTGGDNLAASDIPNLPASKITSGTFADDRIASASTWNNKQNALTTDQLAAANSGITSTKVTTYDGYKSQINAKYTKPTTGIPKTDLASAVQTSLGKADSALQSHQTIKTGSANGTISVGGTDVAVKGLGTAAYKANTYFATAAGNNTFTGNNTFQGGTTHFMTASPTLHDPITIVNSEGVHCRIDNDIGTYYKDNQIIHQGSELTLPSKAGTIALTSDITDTKNTAGSTDTSSKIYLIGATSQAANPQTYSHDTAYVGTDGCLYSNSQKVATLGDNNTFTGTNQFRGGTTSFVTAAFLKAASIQGDPKVTVDANGVLCQTEGDTGTYYKDNQIIHQGSKLTLPSKAGTIALTSDIPSGGGSGDVTAAGNNTFTGNNTFQGGTTHFMTASPTLHDPITIVNSEGVHCRIDNDIGTYYKDNQIIHQGSELTLPSKAGTLATTSDIKIKSATLSGTTLSITLS